jgi:hypothetical protein
VQRARAAAAEQAFDAARLPDAPVPVALHRLAEGLIAAARQWPLDVERTETDPATAAPSAELVARLDAFLERAVEEGALRDGLPAGWARAALLGLVDLAARRQPELAPGPAADVVVDTLLRGLGGGLSAVA